MHARTEREVQSGPMHPVLPRVDSHPGIDVVNQNGLCVSFFKKKNNKKNKDEPTLIHGNHPNSVI